MDAGGGCGAKPIGDLLSPSTAPEKVVTTLVHPIHEVALCGHATLAASHLLWEEGYLAEIDQACFETRSGQLVASLRGEEIELDFPIVPVAAAQEPLRLERILGGVAYRFVGQTQHETERET